MSKKTTPQHHEIIVAGSGPAGWTAAVTAARCGKSVMLIEQNGCLGGVWTSGLLSLVIDTEDKPGALVELQERLKDLDAYIGDTVVKEKDSFVYKPEVMKWVLESIAREAGVDIRLHTLVVDATHSSDHINSITTSSKSGLESWTADLFIDATGDGDLGARSGCSYELGDPQNGETQPMSLLCLFTGVSDDTLHPYICHGHNKQSNAYKAKMNFLELLKSIDISPSYTHPTILSLGHGLYYLMANHQYGADARSADDITQATLEGRNELMMMAEKLRLLPGWKNMQIVTTAEHIGVREGRRIIGEVYLSKEDIIAGQCFDDSICQVYFPVDIHTTRKSKGGGIVTDGVTTKPYQIPLRALIAKDMDNLLLAGRCISGDFYAHASYRVTGNSVMTGQAVGLCASLCIDHNTSPKQLAPEIFSSAWEHLCHHKIQATEISYTST